MKTALRKIIRNFGIDIVRYSPVPPERHISIDYQRKNSSFLKLLNFYEIDLVLDVGANNGQFASKLFKSGYVGKIVSFEPLSSAYEKLLEASRLHPNWEIAPRCAIGDKNTEIEINISNNSESSSVLPILSAHVDAAPNSVYIGSEKVKMLKLSEAADSYMKKSQATFLKIDVQGFEDKVLEGAAEILTNIKGMQLELSFIPLYQGGILFDEMRTKLKKMGFEIYYISPGFSDPRTGRMLQADGIFFRG